MKVEDVSARQLLGCRVWPVGLGVELLDYWGYHFITADYASSISQFLLRCIRIPLIHITGSCLIAVECLQTRYEGTGSNIDIPNNIQRQSVEGDDDTEEDEVSRQFKEV